MKCPECKEQLHIPAALAGLDLYQCQACGFLIELGVDSVLEDTSPIADMLWEIGKMRRTLDESHLDAAIQREKERGMAAEKARDAMGFISPDTYAYMISKQDVRKHRYTLDVLLDVKEGYVK
jgi:hypothetical protein